MSRPGMPGHRTGPEPWLMWGTSQTVPLQFNGDAEGGIAIGQSSQLARVNYKRPDSWHFAFFAQVVNYTIAPTDYVRVEFNLQFGVGRGIIDYRPFCTIQFDAAEFAGGARPQRLVTQTELPKARATDVAPNVIDKFVAQSIQCSAIARTDDAGIPDGAKIEVMVTALFAPHTHNRPDWFLGQMDGDEQGGT